MSKYEDMLVSAKNYLSDSDMEALENAIGVFHKMQLEYSIRWRVTM